MDRKRDGEKGREKAVVVDDATSTAGASDASVYASLYACVCAR